jgi:NADPH:quinone reductase-like Zn-dependent oxidoreductase
MKALCFYEHGDLDVLQYAEVPDPTPGAGEVLVQVKRVPSIIWMCGYAAVGRD